MRLEGALPCADCHRPEGVLDWKGLGYTEQEEARLGSLRTLLAD